MTFAKKSLGQNFLMHPQTAERIVAAANLPTDAVVLEIGPGTGMLTKALLTKVARVVAIEADIALIPALTERFALQIASGKLELINQDIRHFDPASLSTTYHLVANIPYYITGEIIRSFLAASHKPASMTLLVQKEVAERIARNKGKESLLSISVHAYGTPEYCFTVPRGAFNPAPSVDSAVISIQNIQPMSFKNSEAEEWFFTVLKAGFAHKRKQLKGNLEAIAAPDHIQTAFEDSSLDPKIRSEDIPVETWKVVANSLLAART